MEQQNRIGFPFRSRDEIIKDTKLLDPKNAQPACLTIIRALRNSHGDPETTKRVTEQVLGGHLLGSRDAVVNLVRVSLRDHQRFGRPMPRNGNQLGRNVPGTTYPCAPGGPNDYVFLYAQPQMRPAVAKVLGQPELIEDARFKTVEARWDNRAELNAIVEAWTRQRSKHEVMRLMGDAGVPCGACQDTGEVLADPHLKAREMIVDVDYPTRGTYQTVGCPIKLSDSPVAVSRPPLLGEHTDVLLESLCGVEPDEAKRLRQEGVV